MEWSNTGRTVVVTAFECGFSLNCAKVALVSLWEQVNPTRPSNIPGRDHVQYSRQLWASGCGKLALDTALEANITQTAQGSYMGAQPTALVLDRRDSMYIVQNLASVAAPNTALLSD